MDAMPIEVIRKVLDAVVDKGRPTSTKPRLEHASLTKYREQQALIRKLGSVCHRWRSICLEFLFEHVWIAPPLEPNILAFRQIFGTGTLSRYSRNSPGWWTRQLSLEIHFLEPPERKALIDHLQIRNPFPNVSSLSIFHCGRYGDEENGRQILDVFAKQITSLVLSGSKDSFSDVISHVAGALSRLQQLALEFSSYGHKSPPPYNKYHPLVLPSVHDLHLRKPKQNEYFTLLDWSFPSLRKLVISSTYSFPDAFAPFVHLHGSNITNLSLPYWPPTPSIHNDVFEACSALEKLEVLGARWEGDDDGGQLVPVELSICPIMREHRLREWSFKPFWVDCDFDLTFREYTADSELFPSLRKIRLQSPAVDKLFSVPLRKVQSLKRWSRVLQIRGVLLVDDDDGILIFLSTINAGGGTN